MFTTDKPEMSKTLPRQTRNSFSFKQLLLSPPCRACMCSGFLFFAGVMFGVYMDAYFLTDGLLGRPERVAEKSRLGLSIKKDLSIQFRDYIPRLIFIDVSFGPSCSLELFMETYPDAYKYTTYAFLADKSYAELYAKFNKINIFAGYVPSTADNNATSLKLFSEDESQGDVNVVAIDFPMWLKDNVHMDEYVIVKMTTTSQNEEQIARKLVQTGAVEWIDKYYTTSSDDTSLGIIRERFSVRNLEVLFWETDQFTYSDFDGVNPVKPAREFDVKVSECLVNNNSDKFALILYLSDVNQFSLSALRLLSRLSAHYLMKLPVTVLFPLHFLQSATHCNRLSSLKKELSLGLFFKPSTLSLPATEDDLAKKNYIRNKLISAEHCFTRGNATVEYALSSVDIVKSYSGTNTDVLWKKEHPPSADKLGKDDKSLWELHTKYKLLKEQVSERMYTVLSNVIDITPRPGQLEVRLPMQDLNGALLAFDISVEGTDASLLQLIKSHVSDLLPINECVTEME